MEERATDLSPWAHPKAKAWFRALFRRANLPLEFDNELRTSDDQISMSQLRLMLTFAVLLGREEIWPEEEKDVLKNLIRRIRKLVNEPLKSGSGKPLSVAQHQAHNLNVKAMEDEIEIARRRVGMSFRKTPLATPKSWGRFWE